MLESFGLICSQCRAWVGAFLFRATQKMFWGISYKNIQIMLPVYFQFCYPFFWALKTHPPEPRSWALVRHIVIFGKMSFIPKKSCWKVDFFQETVFRNHWFSPIRENISEFQQHTHHDHPVAQPWSASILFETHVFEKQNENFDRKKSVTGFTGNIPHICKWSPKLEKWPH